MFAQVSLAGEWFLRSGIQAPNGGVARYYRIDRSQNQPVSTEITGYTASALTFLHSLTGDARYLDAARAAAEYLTGVWKAHQAMPFEPDPPRFTYFFDCGIIVRGLLAVWRATGQNWMRDCARSIGEAMMRDFAAHTGHYHPILTLPGKAPLEWEPQRWSRSPGCYQLKAGMAWWDLWEATHETSFRDAYRAMVPGAIADARDFLPGHSENRSVVDRLHAFLYFLEGLMPCAAEPECAAALCQGIQRVEHFLREYAPEFERSDVYAQLLRIRLFADRTGAAPLHRTAAEFEAAQLLEFAARSGDPRVDGGFYFGRSACLWEPFSNPVSTAFAVQALALWEGAAAPDRACLI